MSKSDCRAYHAPWFEPAAAIALLGLTLFINRLELWPWLWVVDVIACLGAAVSRRFPVLGAVLVGLGLAVWLPFPGTLSSVSGLAFYINVFAAVRTNLSWQVPLTLGLGGLAYLTLVRNSTMNTAYQWTSSILLLMVLVLVWGGGTALRRAATNIQDERASSHQRLQDLQVSLARELHDSVAQTLSSAAMRSNIAMWDEGMSQATRLQLEKIAEECRSSAHDLRQLLSALRSDSTGVTSPGPLADVESLRLTMNSQAERLRAEGFSVLSNVDVARLSAARCHTMSAIVLEATNNMLKHARPRSECSLTITSTDDDVTGTFTNVPRVTTAVTEGLGLTGIHERLALLDGEYDLHHRAGLWVLAVRLPHGMEWNNTAPLQLEPVSEGDVAAGS